MPMDSSPQAKPRAQMPPIATIPAEPAPPGAVDAHLHLVGADFPLWSGRVEDPADDVALDVWIERYRAVMARLGLDRAVLVHSILYGTDNTLTIEAVRRMGDMARGVGLLSDDANDADMARFADANLKAVRLNYVHGGVLSWEGARAMAPRLRDHGLHIQMLLNSHKHMEEIAGDIAVLGVPLVIDHLGWPDLSLGMDDPGFQTLLRLLGDGHVTLKLSALYRLCPAPYDQAAPFVEAALAANPEALLWGTDWPHLMLADAAMPNAGTLMDVFNAHVPRAADRQTILVDTPTRLFDF
ncbi:MAG: amidohydrolase family protein [Pseudomonadota bacterium]